MKTFGGLRVAVAVLAIIYILIPLIVVIPASFTSANYPSFPAEGFSLQWYAKILERPEFLEAFLNSAKFAALAALFSVIFGTLGALGIAKYDIPGKSYITAPFNFSIKCAAISLRDCTLNVLYTNDACRYVYRIFNCPYRHLHTICHAARIDRFKWI